MENEQLEMTEAVAPKITMIDWFDDHFYKIEIDGNIDFLPSVTTINGGAYPKPFLARWRGDIGNEAADKKMMQAADRGSRVHHACYVFANGGIVIYNPPIRNSFFTDEHIAQIRKDNFQKPVVVIENQDEMYQLYKFQKWWEAVKPNMLLSESIVYSLEHKFAGTLDYVMQIETGEYDIAGSKPLSLEKGNYIVDLKTSAQITDDYYLQIAAYSAALREGLAIEIIGGLIIHTNATTKTGIEGLTTKLRTKDELDSDFQDFLNVKKVWDRTLSSQKPKLFTFPNIISQTEILK